MLNKTKGIVLKKYDFRETSIIAVFYTQDFGKIKGILKGIRQEPKKFATTLESFSLNEIIFYSGKESELHLVSQCDLIENFNNLRNDLRLVSFSSYLVELVDSIMPLEDNVREVHDLLQWSLSAINNGYDAGKISIIFQIKLLGLSGFRPHLDSCVFCQKNFDYQAYFSTTCGGIICKSCFSRETKARAIFRGTLASILHIQRHNQDALLNLGLHPKIKSELKTILSSFIELHLQKQLKSEAVVNIVEGEAGF